MVRHFQYFNKYLIENGVNDSILPVNHMVTPFSIMNPMVTHFEYFKKYLIKNSVNDSILPVKVLVVKDSFNNIYFSALEGQQYL